MTYPEEIQSYAMSFAEEVRNKFRADIQAAASGLASVHAQDAGTATELLWEATIEELQALPCNDDSSEFS